MNKAFLTACEQGDAFIKAKDYASAHQCFDRAVKINNTSERPLIGKGKIYIEEKKIDLAHMVFDCAIELNSASAKPYFWKGRTYYMEGEYSLAHNLYNQAITIDDSDPNAYNGKADIYADEENFELAHSYYDRAINLDDTDPYPFCGKADVYADEEEYTLAHSYYDRAIALDGTDSYHYIGKANVFREQQEYTLAHSYFDRAITLDSTNTDAHAGKALVFQEQRELIHAHACLDRAIVLDAQDPNLFILKAEVFFRQEKWELAHANYDRSILLDSEDADPHYRKGIVYMEQSKWELALASFERATALDEEDAEYFYRKGCAFSKLGEFLLAHECFDESIQLDGSDGWPHVGKVEAFIDEGKLYYGLKHFYRWIYLMGYAWPGDTKILAVSPAATYKIYKAIEVPEWEDHADYFAGLELFYRFEAFKSFQNNRYQLSGNGKGLYQYYMGDAPGALSYFEGLLVNNDRPDLQVCYYVIRSSLSCITSLEEELLQRIESLALRCSLVAEKEGANGKNDFTDQQIRNIYYAGHVLIKFNEEEAAIRCLEPIANLFIPAQILKTWLLFEVGEARKAKQELLKLVSNQSAKKYIRQEIKVQNVSLDTPLEYYLEEYALFDELREPLHYLHHKDVGSVNRVLNGAQLRRFFELYNFSKDTVDKLKLYLRELYFKNFFQAYFNQTLSPLAEELLNDEYSREVEQSIIEKLPNSRPKEIFDRVVGEADEVIMMTIGQYFDDKELKAKQALLLSSYFFTNQRLSAYEKWLLDFYIIEASAKRGWNTEQALDAGTDDAIKHLLSNPINSVSTLFATTASAYAGADVGTFAIGAISSFAIAYLSHRIRGYIKSGSTSFDSIGEFAKTFELFIAKERERLGATAFSEKYPLDLLQ